MAKKLSYKKKNQMLIAIIVIATLVIYKLSLNRTIQKYNEFKMIKNKISNVSSVPKEIELIEGRITKINRFFGNNADSTINKRDLLIDYTSNYCEKHPISIRLIDEPLYEYRDNIFIETNQLILEGSFISMVKYLDQLELYQDIGEISSIKFYKEKNRRTKQEKLLLKIFIQNIISQNDENKTL